MRHDKCEGTQNGRFGADFGLICEISCENKRRGRRKRKRCVEGIHRYTFEVYDFQSKDEMGDLVEFVNLSVTSKGLSSRLISDSAAGSALGRLRSVRKVDRSIDSDASPL